MQFSTDLEMSLNIMTDSAPSKFYILWGSVILGCLMLVGLKKTKSLGPLLCDPVLTITFCAV